MSDHDHGPTARLLDPVYCLTCAHEHIATIPAVTFACDSCGFGAWGHSVAAAHADALPEHIVYPRHHQTICAPPGYALNAWECDHHPEWADNRNRCHHPAHAAPFAERTSTDG